MFLIHRPFIDDGAEKEHFVVSFIILFSIDIVFIYYLVLYCKVFLLCGHHNPQLFGHFASEKKERWRIGAVYDILTSLEHSYYAFEKLLGAFCIKNIFCSLDFFGLKLVGGCWRR